MSDAGCCATTGFGRPPMSRIGSSRVRVVLRGRWHGPPFGSGRMMEMNCPIRSIWFPRPESVNCRAGACDATSAAPTTVILAQARCRSSPSRVSIACSTTRRSAGIPRPAAAFPMRSHSSRASRTVSVDARFVESAGLLADIKGSRRAALGLGSTVRPASAGAGSCGRTGHRGGPRPCHRSGGRRRGARPLPDKTYNIARSLPPTCRNLDVPCPFASRIASAPPKQSVPSGPSSHR